MSMQQQIPSTQNDTLPHGLRDLIPYPESWLEFMARWFLPFLIICFCLVVAIFLWKKFRRKKVKEVIPEHPFILLERKLSSLQAPEPFEGKKSTQYFFDLNMIFRQFIELSFAIPATDLTLKELREPLRLKSSFSRELTEEVLKFLERTERLKFAGVSTNIEEAKECHAQVLQWVSFLKQKHFQEEGYNHR